jgi:hypothetical protein
MKNSLKNYQRSILFAISKHLNTISTFQIGETPVDNNTSDITPGSTQPEQDAPNEIAQEPEIHEEPFCWNLSFTILSSLCHL